MDFTSPDIKYSVIGFTMDVNNEVSASHLLDDTHVNDITSYLKQIGVLYKFKSINKIGTPTSTPVIIVENPGVPNLG